MITSPNALIATCWNDVSKLSPANVRVHDSAPAASMRMMSEFGNVTARRM